jgi:hypothetical protein
MKRIKIIAGITWAFLCLILIIILFPGLNSISQVVSRLPFMKINPNYTGGEVVRQTITPCCTVEVHKPVFDGLINEKNRGFVQIDWRGNIQDQIEDTIDFNLDKVPDFYININTREPDTKITSMNPEVGDVNISTSTSYGWAVRVSLKKN